MSTKISIVAPCEGDNKEKWQREFIGNATRLDTDGFPLEGTLAMGFNVPLDLNSCSDAERKDRAYTAAREARQRAGQEVKEGEIANRLSSLLGAHKHLQPRTIIALKQGFRVLAFVEITGGYHYDGTQSWGKHRWTYRTLRRATKEEEGPYNIPRKGQTSAVPAPVKTFNLNYLPMPADLPALAAGGGVQRRSILLADQKIAERRTAEMAAEETAQRADDAVLAAAEAVQAAMRALEQARETAEAAQAALVGARRDVAAAINERELAELF